MMKRQVWAVCAGMLFGGVAAAQPSLDTERYPLAPAMPGVVVSQAQGSGRPTATVTAMNLKTVSHQTPGSAAPVMTASQAPYTNVATAQVLPVNGMSGPVVASAAPGCGMGGGCSTPAFGGCATGTCTAPAGQCGGNDKLSQWLHFQSTSVQTGHYAMPYYLPLYNWFPCKSQAGCSTCAAPSCAGGQCGGQVVPAGPVSPMMMAPSVIVPTAAVNTPGTPMARPVYTVEMMPAGAVGKSSQADPLANFRKMDGMTFTPGGSPMAAPVSRAK